MLSRPQLDPQKLQHFLAVFEHGNFSRAAQQSHLTQQAVSKSVAKLEETLGVRLFDRGALGAQPTLYAKILARRARIILGESRLAVAEISSLREAQQGSIQFGAGWTFIPRIVPTAVERFRENFPNIGLSVLQGTTPELFPKLVGGELEFVVSAPPGEDDIDPSLVVRELFTDNDVLIVRREHPLADQSCVELADLSRCTWLVALSLPERWQAICSAFVAQGVEPPTDIVNMDSVTLAKSMLLSGDYVCLLSEELVAQEQAAGLCKAFRLKEFPLNRRAVLATRAASPLQPAAAELSDIIVDVCRALYP